MPATTLPGAAALSPLRQGELSSLCGVYSVLNSMQLVAFPRRLTRADIRDLYADAIRHLSKRRQLKRVMRNGMSIETWAELTSVLLELVNAKHGTALTVAPLFQSEPPPRSIALLQMRSCLNAGRPIMVCFGPPLDHYTIIAGMTSRAFILFDSLGLRWMRIRNVGLQENSPRTHWLMPSSLRIIFDDW